MNQEYVIHLNEKEALEAIEISSLNINLNCPANYSTSYSDEFLSNCVCNIYQQLVKQINFYSKRNINEQMAKLLIIKAYYQNEKIFSYQATLLHDKKKSNYNLYLKRLFNYQMNYLKTKEYILALSEKDLLEQKIELNLINKPIKL